MKRTIIIPIALMLIMTAVSAHPGPARDSLQVITDELKGSTVSAAQGASILEAFITSPRFEAQYENTFVGTVVDGVLIPVDPGTLTTEERAQFVLDRLKDFIKREVRKKAEVAETATQEALLEAAVAAAGDAATVLE